MLSRYMKQVAYQMAINLSTSHHANSDPKYLLQSNVLRLLHGNADWTRGSYPRNISKPSFEVAKL